MSKRKLVKRNPIARALADPLYRKRVVKSKKVYTRKKKGKLNASPYFYLVTQ